MLFRSALCIEFRLRKIPFAREVVVDVHYKGEKIGTKRLEIGRASCRERV